MQERVVVLSTQSLFAEGIANRLQQHLRQVEFKIVDPRQPDTMAQIIAIQPSIVFLDVTDLEAVRYCSLSKLLLSLPKLKVIRLNPQQGQIQVVTSEQHRVTEVRDLVDVIESSAVSSG